MSEDCSQEINGMVYACMAGEHMGEMIKGNRDWSQIFLDTDHHSGINNMTDLKRQRSYLHWFWQGKSLVISVKYHILSF